MIIVKQNLLELYFNTNFTSECHVPFSSFIFNPDRNLEDGEVKSHKEKMVQIPINIAANGNVSRSEESIILTIMSNKYWRCSWN